MSGYDLLRELTHDQFHALWRGLRTEDRASCLVKVPRSDPPTRLQVHLLRQEDELRRGMRGTRLVPTEGLADVGGRPGLVLRDCPGQPLGSLHGVRGEVGRWLPLAIRLAATIDEVHRQGITLRSFTSESFLADETTNDVFLIDLAFAVREEEHAAEPLPLSLMRRRLTYVAPEQTGRTNRRPDHRADLYALGVVLYELVTGRPPFPGSDPLELLHAHVAKHPPRPEKLEAEIPPPVGAILLKLLSKNPDDRYWSARGLREDLEECARRRNDRGSIDPFPLGRRDVPDRFIPSQKLYGRGGAAERLRSSFEAAAAGPAACVFVSGYSGVGKTSLVQELLRPVTLRRGSLVTGKCDQIVRSLPYAALFQAFRSLVDRMLSRSEESLALWRRKLEAALGTNLGVLAEVMPEIRLVVGDPPRPPALDPAESQNRFRSVIRAFVGTIAGPEHPVVLFLDDLQWIDSATLDLIEPLVTDPDIRSFLLVGAYRDNEVAPDHPLSAVLDRLARSRTRTERLHLPPLQRSDLVRLVADTFQDEEADADTLAGLVLDKTGGNPFFAIQFLKTLHEEGLVRFDEERGRWRFRIEEIRRARLTENVADLLARRIRRLPAETRTTLELAACVGGTFDATLLAVAAGKTPESISALLAPAIAEGIVVAELPPESFLPGDEPREATCSFVHDRVQHAAYALIPEEDRPLKHAHVGRLLWQRWGDPPPDDRLFELAHHLNLGRAHLESAEEHAGVARLDLAAVRRAKSATAYREALAYALAGIEQLQGGLDSRERQLAWELHLETAECEYLCGNFEAAERYFRPLIDAARDRQHAVEVYCLMTRQYENMTRYGDALDATREGLARFDLDLPESPEALRAALNEELELIETVRGGRPIASLVDLPRMADSEIRSLIRLLMTAWAPTYLSGAVEATRLLSARIVRLSLEHGNTEESAYGYVTHAITVGPVLRDYEASYEWGRLALAANERFEDRRLRAKIHQQFQAHVNPWRRPLETCIPHAREARRAGLESGDFTYAGYGALTESWAALLRFRDLEDFLVQQAPNLALLSRLQMTGLADLERAILAFARGLRGRPSVSGSLAEDDFDEEAFERDYEGRPFFLTILNALRLWTALLHHDRESVALHLEGVRGSRAAVQGTVWAVVIDWLEGLGVSVTSAPNDREAIRRVAELHDSLEVLAENAPANWAGLAAFLQAELRGLEGRGLDSLAAYERAIALSREHGTPGVGAMAAEFAVRRCLELGHTHLAVRYLRDARSLYESWGATAMVRDLRARHADLLRFLDDGSALREPASSARDAEVAIDVETFARAAGAIAGEIVLDTLLERLVEIAVENAGAERGVFLRDREDRLAPAAAWGEGPPGTEPFSAAIARYARNTAQAVVVADAVEDPRWAADPYVVEARPRSILCLPIHHQGRFAGLLYLENNLGPDAFSPARVRVTEALSGQIAISLENARLYDEMRQEVERRTLAEEELRRALRDLVNLKNRLQQENEYLREEIHRGFDEIVGDSPPMRAVLERIERVAPTEATVLILGETGTGKELLARAIHRLSPRHERPLTKINCGAIPSGLVESELFGHVKGAFTGAVDRRVGRFELADGGTIFLDEVGELPADVQVKLLRVLQEREFEPVGSDRTVRVDVRVVAATNRDLREAVEAGRFRSDLYYRLCVVPVEVPPLRARPTDIPKLVSYFVDRACRTSGRTIEAIPDDVLERLVAYPWPGNVRELQNVMERAVILSPGPRLELDGGLLPEASPGPEESQPGLSTLEDAERRHILDALAQTGGVIEGPRGAARLLDIHPNTLRSRMKKLGVRRDDGIHRVTAPHP